MSRRHRNATALPGLALLLVGCASAEPLDMALGSASEEVAVTILGDGFVRTATERMPREAFVLRLRLRTRAMSAAERGAVRVAISVDEHAGDGAAADSEWLFDQLQIMGISQARYL